jgi:hypothetical protein
MFFMVDHKDLPYEHYKRIANCARPDRAASPGLPAVVRGLTNTPFPVSVHGLKGFGPPGSWNGSAGSGGSSK